MMKIIKTKNKKIKFEIYNSEKSDKNPVIFLPGYNMKPKDYKLFLKKLNKKVYAIDYWSSKPTINSINDYVQLVNEFIKKLKLKNYYLVGHSLGGGTAFLLSKKITPKKAVAINPLAEVDYKLKEYPKRFLEVAKDKFFKRLGLYIIFIIRYILHLKSLRNTYKSLDNFKIPSKIKIPFLVLLAEKDEFFEEKHIPKQKFENLKFIKTPGRHFNLIHFAEQVSKKVNRFLDKII